MTEFESVMLSAEKEQKDKNAREIPQDETQQSDTQKKSYKERMEEKKTQCYSMIDDACVDVVADVERLKRFLAVQAHFEQYSLNNNLLIYTQKPTATRVRDFDSWKDMGASVKKGATSLMILEPYTFVSENDGKKHRGYNAKHVFDVSDVVLPDDEEKMPTEHEEKALMRALIHDSPVPIRRMEQSTNKEPAFYHVKEGVIYYKTGIEFNHMFPSIAKALAHAEFAKGDERYRFTDHEFQARCVSYVVSSKYGVDVSAVDIHAIPQKYAELDSEDLKKELADIHMGVKNIGQRMRSVLYRSDREEKEEKPKQDEQKRFNKSKEIRY